MKAPPLDALPCPLCRRALEPVKGQHGLVWLCRECRAGAATLPILRQVAPRTFVNRLWQAALHDGRRSTLVCPSCTKPFTEFGGGAVNRQLKVCVRCFWVWLSARASASLSARAIPAVTPDETRALVPSRASRGSVPSAANARHTLGKLTAGVLVRALSTDRR